MSVLDNQKVVRKWKLKRWPVGIASLLVMATVAYAAGGFDRLKDTVKIGQGTATNKNVIFDIGSGNSNPVIRSTSGGLLQFSNNGVDFSTFGSGGGGLGINHVTNPDFELNANGYSAYQDAAGAAPVDATGGTPTVAITRTTVSGEIIRGTGSGKIIKDAVNRQGEGISVPFTLDNADKNTQQNIQFDYSITGTYADCDVMVYVVETTGPNVLSPSQQCLSHGNGHFQATYQSLGTTSYRLALHVASTSAAAYTIFIDNVQTGPGSVVIGPTVQDWQTYTPVVTGTGCSNFLTGHSKRVGDTVFFKVSCYDAFGVRSSTTPIHISLPFPVDATWLTTNEHLGYATITNSAGGATAAVGSVYDLNYGGSQDVIAAKFQDSVALRDVDFGNINSQWQVYGSYKVSGWDSSVFLSNTSVEYAYNSDTSDADNSVAFAHGSEGVNIGSFSTARNKLVRFHTPIQPTDKLALEIEDPTHENWWDIAVVTNENGLVPYQAQNGVGYGIGIATNATSNNTDVMVTFGTYGSLGTTFGGAGGAWSGFVGYHWRVVKSSNPLTLGHNLVTQSNSGLVKQAGQLLGTNTNDVASTGYVGEVVETIVTYPTSVPAGVCTTGYCDLGTVVLTAGDWQCSATETINSSSANTPTSYNGEFALSSCTGNCFSDFVPGANQIFWSSGTGGNPPLDVNRTITIPAFQVRSNGGTMTYLGQTVGTQNLHFKATFTTPVSGNYNVGGHLQCVRMR